MGRRISVIMGVYNCEETLAEALNSIVNQTCTDWEIIMCDDCSKDKTLEVAEQYKNYFPAQIKILKNEKNMGLNFTLNKCLREAQGEYIARMDGDDICSPDRFEKEIAVLENNSDIAIVSTDMSFFDDYGVWGQTHVDPNPQKYNFLKSTPFCHAACMVRKEAYLAVEGYTVEKKLLRVEDYYLWIKMYEKGYRGVNIQEPLYSMRDDRNAQKRRKFKYRLNEAYVKAYAIRHLGLPKYTYIYCLRPIVIGLMPSALYRIAHRKKRSGD